jgi:hypothetical protein
MSQIQFASIEKAIQKIDNLDEDALERISETFALEQEVLIGYMMSAAIEYDNEQLEGLLVYYFCLIMEIFKQAEVKITRVTEEMIDEFQEPYFDIIDEYFESNDEEILYEYTHQEHMVNFLAMEISEPDTDGTSLDDETASQLYIVLLAMVTLLDKSIETKAA